MWKYIKYKFNKAFEKNILFLFFFIFAASVLGILFCAIVLFLLQEIGILSEESIFLQNLWNAFNLFYNQNAFLELNIEDNNFFDFFFKFGVTIFGILIFSTIIGIITSFIGDRVQSLRAGKGKIEEENHIIFFNFSIQLIPLITELCVAYAKEKKTFVIVSNEEPLTITDRIHSIVKIPKNISIVARKGFAWQSKILERINLEKAKQIIILKPDVGENYPTELDCDVEVGKSFAFLITNKYWQRKLFRELQREFGVESIDGQTRIPGKEIHNLKDMKQFMDEVLRLASPVQTVQRSLTQDVLLHSDIDLATGQMRKSPSFGATQYLLKAGGQNGKGNSFVFVHLLGIHRQKDLWGEDAFDFNPDRWAPENLWKMKIRIEKKCNLNRDCQPTQDVYKDYSFCSKGNLFSFLADFVVFFSV